MKYVNYVNVKMGTDSVPEFSNGNTLPITAYPFGANHFSPETRKANLFFNPHDVIMNGIRLTHQVSPWLADFNSFTIMSAIDNGNKYLAQTTTTTYNRDSATLTPAYIKMHLNFFNADIEFAPTSHGGIYKTKWGFEGFDNYIRLTPANGNIAYHLDESKSVLFLTVKSNPTWIKISEDFKLFAAFTFDKKPLSVSEKDGVILVKFGKRVKNVTARFGTSFISEEQAEFNLVSEVKDKNIAQIRILAEKTWEHYLSKIEIEAPKKQMQTFYSCFYRCFLFPRALHEICPDGAVRHGSPATGNVFDGPFYTDNCFWDTYRTLFPLYSLIDSKLYAEMCEGFLNFYRESGWLPRCAAPSAANCMPGTAIDAVFADAIVKGVVKDQCVINEMLDSLVKHAYTVSDDPAAGRDGVADFNTLGYVSSKYRESVNKTLDYAYGNFCIAQVARAAGNEKLAAELKKTAYNYKNLFDPATEFFRAKDENGKMRDDFSEFDWGGDYTEGSVWQNNFSVYHDMLGHASLLGGKDKFLKLAHRLFATPPLYTNFAYPREIHEMTEMAAAPQFGQCALSNQPSFHLPYIFSCMGDRDTTAYWVRKAVKELFDPTPTGFPGDEDTGSMGAWYVFSTLGFYPVCPGTDEYVLASPSVKSAVVHLDNGKDLTVNAAGSSIKNIYAKTITLDGNKHKNVYITQDELKNGGVLEFEMSNEPSGQKYTDSQLPYSLSKQ